MREAFLHYCWRLARFDLRELKTTTGQQITIVELGEHNQNAGPDFLGSRLQIDGIEWAGNVEIHQYASEWYRHKHDTDAAYENVILHVVLEEDRPVFRPNGERIPCLELRGRIPGGLVKTYWRLLHNAYWVPCQNQIGSVNKLVKQAWLDRLLVERLGRRAAEMKIRLDASKRDWEAVFYQSLASSLGGKVNAEAMDMLARSLPLRIVLKHQHSRLQLEALFFGQAGLIPATSDELYPQQLAREYQVLSTKYKLRALPPKIWRYLRLRPANFPEVRIAQLACLFANTGQLFAKTIAVEKVNELMNMYVVQLSNYWQTHFKFGSPSKASPKRLGKPTIQNILINTVAPIYLLYGKLRGDLRFQERALSLLADLPAEKNHILNGWQQLGFKLNNAAASQALLELKKHYCDQKRCLHCSIGCAILKTDDQAGPALTLNEEAQVYTKLKV